MENKKQIKFVNNEKISEKEFKLGADGSLVGISVK